MNDLEIINLWKSYDQKLEQVLLFNQKNAVEITQLKIEGLLASMSPLKIFTVLTGIIWVLFVDVLLFQLFHVANPFFLISAGLQSLLTSLAIGIYIYQLIFIHQADLNRPVLATQKKINRLKSSTIWVARILFLQLPLWTTFYWNGSMLENGNAGLYVIQLFVTGSFTFAAVWLFVNIRFENREKKWFKLIFNGKEWNPVMQSMELLKETAEYTDESITSR